MPQFANPSVYTPVMKTIHWTTAAIVIALLILGWTMTASNLITESTRGTLFGWHKSLGVTILLLSLVRFLGVRHAAPAMPAGLRPWEAALAGLVHKLFYVLLILQPLTGWMLHTVEPHKALFFDLFPIPGLPFLAGYVNSRPWPPPWRISTGPWPAPCSCCSSCTSGRPSSITSWCATTFSRASRPAALAPLLGRLRGDR